MVRRPRGQMVSLSPSGLEFVKDEVMDFFKSSMRRRSL